MGNLIFFNKYDPYLKNRERDPDFCYVAQYETDLYSEFVVIIFPKHEAIFTDLRNFQFFIGGNSSTSLKSRN